MRGFVCEWFYPTLITLIPEGTSRSAR